MKTKQPIENHVLTHFTVKLPDKVAKEIRGIYNKECRKRQDWPYMLALQPYAKAGTIKVNIISNPLGEELLAVIKRYQSMLGS